MTNCHHCNKMVQTTREHVSIMEMASATSITGVLLFHRECFGEVAGNEYLSELKESIASHRLMPNEQTLVKQGQHIPAIKAIRVRTGMGLKEAKDLADMYRNSLRENYTPKHHQV